jgi:hypothetical protein
MINSVSSFIDNERNLIDDDDSNNNVLCIPLNKTIYNEKSLFYILEQTNIRNINNIEIIRDIDTSEYTYCDEYRDYYLFIKCHMKTNKKYEKYICDNSCLKNKKTFDYDTHPAWNYYGSPFECCCTRNIVLMLNDYQNISKLKQSVFIQTIDGFGSCRDIYINVSIHKIKIYTCVGYMSI